MISNGWNNARYYQANYYIDNYWIKWGGALPSTLYSYVVYADSFIAGILNNNSAMVQVLINQSIISGAVNENSMIESSFMYYSHISTAVIV